MFTRYHLDHVDGAYKLKLKTLINDLMHHLGYLYMYINNVERNQEAERNFAGSSLYISSHIFLKFSNTSANNNLLL